MSLNVQEGDRATGCASLSKEIGEVKLGQPVFVFTLMLYLHSF